MKQNLPKYDIRITFPNNQYTCWFSDLSRFFEEYNVNWPAFNNGSILYYASVSPISTYDFKVLAIDHDNKIVELIAIPEGY